MAVSSVAALFIAFASAPITSLTYVPVYAVLWIAFLIPLQAQRRVVLWRWGTIAFALLVTGIDRSTVLFGCDGHDVGTWGRCAADFPSGLEAVVTGILAGTRCQACPLCSNHMQLMCPSAIIGWFEIAVLGGAAFLVFARLRRETALWHRDHRSRWHCFTSMRC